MNAALKKAADVLRDIHDGVEVKPKKRVRRPYGLCHCQHCHFTRLEEKS